MEIPTLQIRTSDETASIAMKSVSFDVYVKFSGTKAQLARLPEKELGIRVTGESKGSNPYLCTGVGQ